MTAAPAWMADAACAGRDAELWFPNPGDNPAPAKTICRDHCPVTMACLAYALAVEASADLRFGIYGGLTAGERQRLRPHRACALCDAPIKPGVAGGVLFCEACRRTRRRVTRAQWARLRRRGAA